MDVESGKPVYLKPRLSPDLLSWGWRFNRAATQSHVDRAAPVLRDLHLASRDCYREWATLWDNAFELVERGMLMLCSTTHGLEEEARAAEYARRLGMQAEVLTAAETAEREPALRMKIAGAVYFRDDCQVTPMRVMAVLAREVERLGVQVLYNAGMETWRRTGDRIDALRTRGGAEQSADEYVVCAGFWSQDVVRELGVDIPMQAGKGCSLTLDKPGALPRICAILSEARVAVTPMDGLAAIRRNDGARRRRREHRWRSRSRHGQVDRRLLSGHHPGAVAERNRAHGLAAVLAGRPALCRARVALPQSIGRDRARKR